MKRIRCEYCGQEFVCIRSTAAFHSNACRQAHHKLMHSREGSRLWARRLRARAKARERNNLAGSMQ